MKRVSIHLILLSTPLLFIACAGTPESDPTFPSSMSTLEDSPNEEVSREAFLRALGE